MIQVTKAPNEPLQDALFQTMFADRKQVFVDLLKWDVPALGAYEIDQFDTPDAQYLIATDGQAGVHRGSVRLLPSRKAHILADLFPSLCSCVPRGESIYEITRLCLSPSLERPARRIVFRQIVTALAEFARIEGIQSYTAVVGIPLLSQILSFGWRAHPLGLPQDIGGERVCALQIHIESDTIECLLSSGTYCPSGLVFADQQVPVAA